MTDAATRVRDWLSRTALPFWATKGSDPAGGFVERLCLDGTPDLAIPKRLRVQARQIYVYSHAAVLGLLPDAAAIAGRGYDFVMAHGCPDGVDRGFVHSLARHGAVVDARRDTYDHAFLLFAFAWYLRATGCVDVRALLYRLCDAIWALLRHPSGQGFLVDDRKDGGHGAVFHQNPHMHLFEALLAAHDATGDGLFLERAGVLFALFRDRMFDPRAGVLREYYDAGWRPALGDAGDIVEPGHHCEWVWLLKWYADRAGIPMGDEAPRLHAFAERYGRDAGGLLVDELGVNGTCRKASRRSWPQTEAIKAAIAMAEAGVETGDIRSHETIDRMVEALFATYLDRPFPGGWVDWIDEGGAPLTPFVPASTFYHLFLSMAEYLRFRADRGGAR